MSGISKPGPAGAQPKARLDPVLESRTMQPVRSTELDRAVTLASGMELTAIEHKRSTVSVRLTDAEFLRLKERAGESGISVSAYMRSCILDADQLRTQVKQALAEMRAMTARPDPAVFNALPSPERNVSVHSGDWFRVIVRSAAFLLSPLFPFRRSA